MGTEEEIDGIDVIGAFVLGSGDERYGIWDRTDTSTPIATFSGDDRGLDQAERLFVELSRSENTRRLPRVLLSAAVGGAAVWILAGLVREILTFVSTTPLLTFASSGQRGPGLTKAIEIAQIIENLGFRVGAAAVLVLGATWIARSLRSAA